ncbi:cro-like repressor protein [Rhizobium phage RHph_TM16]|nr:cro-like repressor protein [Rhizobium phage RHph_TM16]
MTYDSQQNVKHLMEYQERVVTELENQRQRINMSERELSRTAGVNRTNWQRIKKGQKAMTLIELAALCEALALKVEMAVWRATLST